ncbi:MAG: hypothetical protein F7B60_00195 [Desulfurococcales archaeon]|nr:hypothetical protein [Desulfurococcales archaeon]
MLNYRKNTVNSSSSTVWSLLESAGLVIILLFDLGLAFLTLKARIKLWKWLSVWRFRRTLRKAKLPRDLEQYLVDRYTVFLEENLSLERLINVESIGKWFGYTKISRSIKIH